MPNTAQSHRNQDPGICGGGGAQVGLISPRLPDEPKASPCLGTTIWSNISLVWPEMELDRTSKGLLKPSAPGPRPGLQNQFSGKISGG